MLYYEASTRKVHALNGSGTSPAALTLERCLSDLASTKGSEDTVEGPPSEIPSSHPHSVTVPGTVAGWCDAVSSFGSGTLSMSELLEPAATLAEEGFPVSTITAHHWDLCRWQLAAGPHGHVMLKEDGTAPSTGDVFRNPDLAGVLREIGKGGKDAFYAGRIGSSIVEVLEELGGVMTMEDLKVWGSWLLRHRRRNTRWFSPTTPCPRTHIMPRSRLLAA